MKIISILLVVLGVIGIACGLIAVGDIGIACLIGGATAFLSGIGFWIAADKIKKSEITMVKGRRKNSPSFSINLLTFVMTYIIFMS